MPTPFLFGNYFGMLILVYHRRERLELTMPHTTNVIDLKLKIQSLTQILPQNQNYSLEALRLALRGHVEAAILKSYIRMSSYITYSYDSVELVIKSQLVDITREPSD